MRLRRGQRVAFRGRTGTVKSTRPGGMVDVQFDDRRTGERRPAQDLRPVRSNPDSLSQEEAAELPEKEWLVYAKNLYEDRLQKIKGREQALKRNAQAQKKIHKAKEDFIADKGLRKFETVDMTLKDVDYTPRSPEAIYQTKIHDAERSAVEIKGTITALKKALGELSTGKYPNQRFSSAKAKMLQKVLRAKPGRVSAGALPKKRPVRKARTEREATARTGRKRGDVKTHKEQSLYVQGKSLGQQVKQQDALFRIVPDQPRSSPSSLSECGNPIDGKAYVMVISAVQKTMSRWVTFADLHSGSGDIVFSELANKKLWREGRSKRANGTFLEAVEIPPEAASVTGSVQSHTYINELPAGTELVNISALWVQTIRQKKGQGFAGKGHGKKLVKRQAGGKTTLHVERNLPPQAYLGRDTEYSKQINNPIILRLENGNVRAFRAVLPVKVYTDRIKRDFSPFPLNTAKGKNPFFSWVPEEVGEFQKILNLSDPDAGQVPCLDPQEKTQVKVAKQAISRAKGDFSKIRSWRKFLSGEQVLDKPQWATSRMEAGGRAVRDLYMLGRSIRTDARGYGMLHDFWKDGNPLVGKLTRYPLSIKESGFLEIHENTLEVISPEEAKRLFLQAAEGKSLPMFHPVAKFLATVARAKNLAFGFFTYLEREPSRPLPRVPAPKGTVIHWDELSDQGLSKYVTLAFKKTPIPEDMFLKDALKVIADLAEKSPRAKLPIASATSLFWYYALFLSIPDLGGPLSRGEEVPSLGIELERAVLPLIIASAGGSTMGQAATGESQWRAYKTYNPLVFKVTQEYFRDRGKWGTWAQHPEISQEAEYVGYYGALLRLVQMAEVLLVSEGSPPRGWEDLAGGVDALLRSKPALWGRVAPSWWSLEQEEGEKEGFLHDPQGYVQYIKKLALPGLVHVGSLRRTALAKSEEFVMPFRSGTSHGDRGYPEGSVASQMTEREQTRQQLTNALDKAISRLT